jgi:hypothetical protein
MGLVSSKTVSWADAGPYTRSKSISCLSPCSDVTKISVCDGYSKTVSVLSMLQSATRVW